MMPTELYSTSSRPWDSRMVRAGEATFGVVEGEEVVDDPLVLAQVGDDAEPLHQHGLMVGREDEVADGGEQVQAQLAKLEVVGQDLGALEVEDVAEEAEECVEEGLVSRPRSPGRSR